MPRQRHVGLGAVTWPRGRDARALGALTHADPQTRIQIPPEQHVVGRRTVTFRTRRFRA